MITRAASGYSRATVVCSPLLAAGVCGRRIYASELNASHGSVQRAIGSRDSDRQRIVAKCRDR